MSSEDLATLILVTIVLFVGGGGGFIMWWLFAPRDDIEDSDQ